MSVTAKKKLFTPKDSILSEIIENITINDDDWQCIVTMLIETLKNQIYLTSILNEVCEKGYRKAIFLINRSEIYNNFGTSWQSHENTSEVKCNLKFKKYLVEDIRQYFRQILQSDDRSEKSLPHHFEAALVKWMIYEARLKYLKIRQIELEKETERAHEFIEMQKESKKLYVNEINGVTKVGIKTNTEPRNNSRLIKRNNEWKNIIYIDDAPKDGPNMYILLTGFHNSELPMELIKIGVPLSCILRLESPDFIDDHTDYMINSIEFEIGKSVSPVNCLQLIKKTKNCESNNPVDFWTNLDTSSYCNIGIRCYRPPSIISNDLYDNISYVLYDFHQTMQDHIRYLNSMQVYQVYEPKCENQEICTYKNLINSIPEEYISIAIILEAVLRQIENNFEILEQKYRENNKECGLLSTSLLKQPNPTKKLEEFSLTLSYPICMCTETTSSSNINSTSLEELEEKLHPLHLKYEVISPPNKSSEHLSNPELIFHGDFLRINACCVDNQRTNFLEVESEMKLESKSNFKHFANFQVKLIENPRITEAWYQNSEVEMENCKTHLPGIFKHCEKQGLNQSKTNHLLNISGLQKLIESYFTSCNYLRNNSLSSEDKQIYKDDNYNKCDSSIKSTSYVKNKNQLQENLTNNNNLNLKKNEISKQKNLILKKNKDTNSDCYCYFQSDSQSTQNKSWRQSLNSMRSSESFSNISNFNSETSLFEQSTNKISSISIRNSLSKHFLQSFEQCSDLFSLIDVHQNLKLQSFKKQCPVTVEDFEDAEFIAPDAFLQIIQNCFEEYEDEGFIAKHFLPTDSVLLVFCKKPQQPNEIIEENVTCVVRTPVCLQDFCHYILDEEVEWVKRQRKTKCDNGLLNRYQSMQSDTGEEIIEGPIFKNEDFLLLKSLKASDLLLNKIKQKQNKDNDSVKKSKKALNQEKFASLSSSSSGAMSEILMSSLTPKFEFTGYDLGERRRVQVSNRSWTFESNDGIRVRLIRETWLQASNKEQKTTSVRINVHGNLNETLRYHEMELNDTFIGVFNLTMANGIILAFSKLNQTLVNIRPNKLLYDIQISWPSGLIIKPVEHRDTDFPFYILQYHSKKGLECKTIKNETHRKYLHNGDVVQFFNDDSIIILRPNGTIITVTNFFNGAEKSLSYIEEDDGLYFKNTQFYKSSSSFHQSMNESNWFYSEDSPLYCTVVETDGRHYEVYDGHIVKELKPLRTSIAETYSTEEKFIRRDDGTDIIINSDAELFVSFPDGTRMQMSCLIENTLLHCEWSEEEIQHYFGQKEPEGFVSIVTYSRAEHPSYAAVSCEPPGVGIYGLSMGESVSRLQLKQHGFGDFSINNELRLEFNENRVLLTQQECCCQGYKSTVMFDVNDQLSMREESKTLLTIHDRANNLIVKRNDAGFTSIKDVETINGNGKGNNDRKVQCRIFALNRNGQAYEYHRHADWQEYEERISKDDRLSLIHSGDDWLSLEASKTIMNSSMNTSGCYEIPDTKPSDKYRIKSQENEEVWDQPFKAIGEQPIPFLIARIFKKIVRPNENLFKNLQEALVCYWKEIATGIQESEYSCKDIMKIKCECQDEIISQINDIALGITKTIDRKMYETGREYIRKMKVKQNEDLIREIINRIYIEKDITDDIKSNI